MFDALCQQSALLFRISGLMFLSDTIIHKTYGKGKAESLNSRKLYEFILDLV